MSRLYSDNGSNHVEFCRRWANKEILTATAPADRRQIGKLLDDYDELKCKVALATKMLSSINIQTVVNGRENHEKLAKKIQKVISEIDIGPQISINGLCEETKYGYSFHEGGLEDSNPKIKGTLFVW